MAKLIQRRLFTKWSFELKDYGVDVHERNGLIGLRYKVPYESIVDSPVELSVASKPWFWWMLFAWIAVLVSGIGEFSGMPDVQKCAYLIWSVVAAVSTIAFLSSRKEMILWSSSEPSLKFLKGLPDESTLKSFVEKLHEQRKQCLISRLMLIDSSGSYADELLKLSYMKQQGIITDEEFIVLKNDCLKNAQRIVLQPPSLN